MTRFERRSRRLLCATLVALSLPAAAGAMSDRAVAPAPQALPVSFGDDAARFAREPEAEVAVQLASLHGDMPRRVVVRTVVPGAATAADKQAATQLSLAILLGAVMLVVLRSHQRTVQARARGPRPTGEA